MPNNTNQLLNPVARNALEKMKFETAAELGIADYASIDKGALPTKINGAVGGNMVKKMIAAYKASLINQ